MSNRKSEIYWFNSLLIVSLTCVWQCHMLPEATTTTKPFLLRCCCLLVFQPLLHHHQPAYPPQLPHPFIFPNLQWSEAPGCFCLAYGVWLSSGSCVASVAVMPLAPVLPPEPTYVYQSSVRNLQLRRRVYNSFIVNWSSFFPIKLQMME